MRVSKLCSGSVVVKLVFVIFYCSLVGSRIRYLCFWISLLVDKSRGHNCDRWCVIFYKNFIEVFG